MMMNGDKFFVAELQKEGFDIDYKKLVEIYRNSRQNEEYKNRKAKQARDESAMMAYAEKIGLD